MFRNSLLLTVLLTFFILPGNSTIYYVAANGSDANAGTIGSPFLTIQRAQTSVVAGDTVYVRGGTYLMQESQIATFSGTNPVFAYVTHLLKSGTSGKYINYWNYPGEQPVFDYSNVKPLNTRINAFEITGSWIYIKGLEVVGVQVTTAQNINTQSICYSQSGAGGNNIYEQLKMHDGMAIGFYLTRGGNTLVLNCDAWNNWDNVSADKLGGNVDGFGAHPNNSAYTGIVFRGCRAWFNSDDGFDCISSHTAITFENCWAMYNGYSSSFQNLANGIGFKAGGYGVSTSPSVPATIPRNIVRNCLAVQNKSSGFYANHHPGGINWFNNTAYRNSTNYNMLNRRSDYQADAPGYGHVIQNNISFSPRSTNSNITDYDPQQCTMSHNTFLNSAVTLTSADFVSLDTALLRASRQADGSLPSVDFMRLAQGSDLIDAGTNVGLPYNGSAPDIGAFESNYSALPVQRISFTAAVVEKSVMLRWEVAGEAQNKGWFVERLSPNGNAWETIGFVNGKGISTERSFYSFMDSEVSIGANRYRLKQIDFDGNSKYSNIETVTISKASKVALSVYPVPVTSATIVSYFVPEKTKVTLSLYNASGQVICTLLNKESEAGHYKFRLPEELFITNGTYILVMSAGNEIAAKTITR